MEENQVYTGQRHDNEVYWKLYKSSRTGLMTVVCMQWFDEWDYHEENFVRDKDGSPYYFMDEDFAAVKLNEWFETEQIDPEYRHRGAGAKDNLVR